MQARTGRTSTGSQNRAVIKALRKLTDNTDVTSGLENLLGGSEEFPSLFGDSQVWQNNNEVYFYSEVTDKSVLDLVKGVRAAERFVMKTAIDLGMDPTSLGITIRINSYGGSVHAGFAAMDTIKACKVPVTTIVEGVCASAGTFISTAGTKRLITANSLMLIHQLSAESWGKFDDMEDELINLTLVMDKIRAVYETSTKLKKTDINNILKRDLWWDAKKCVQVGLADAIA